MPLPFNATVELRLQWGGDGVAPAASSIAGGSGRPRVCYHVDQWSGKPLSYPEDGFLGRLAQWRRNIGGVMQTTFVKATGGDKIGTGGDGSGSAGAGKGDVPTVGGPMA